MVSIHTGNKMVVSVCGKQKTIEDAVLRTSYNVLTVPLAEGELKHHTLTGEMVFISNEEKNNADVKAELTRRWFYVPEDFDDCKFSEQVRTVAELLIPQSGRLTGFTVLTTCDCNARCYYCFEKGTKRYPMSEKTAHDTAAFIIRSCGGEKVEIRWFGGEPLYNRRAIDIIIGDLKAAGIDYSSKMVSNGYLFDEEIINKAVELWKLKKVQITLDGREEVYNRTKAFIYKNANAYQKVTENIDRLLERGIKVVIRLNLSMQNAEELSELSEELAERFGGRKGFSVYSHLLFDYLGNGAGFSSPDDAIIADVKLKNKLESLGLAKKRRLDGDYRTTHCMAASDKSVLIAPDGHLGKCEHHVDDGFIGTVNEGITDRELVARWKERPERTEKCKICAAYPICSRKIRNCPSFIDGCSETRKKSELDDIKRRMLNTYEMWKAEQSAEE